MVIQQSNSDSLSFQSVSFFPINYIITILKKKLVYIFHTNNAGRIVITKSENIRYKKQEESIIQQFIL
jgi:hypothetical protein